MKKLTKLSLIALAFVAMLFMQNCTSESELVIEPQNSTISGTSNVSNTASRFATSTEGQWRIMIHWPSHSTEDQRNWTRNWYISDSDEFVEGEGVSFDVWISNSPPPFYMVMCDGCDPRLTTVMAVQPITIISIEAY